MDNARQPSTVIQGTAAGAVYGARGRTMRSTALVHRSARGRPTRIRARRTLSVIRRANTVTPMAIAMIVLGALLSMTRSMAVVRRTAAMHLRLSARVRHTPNVRARLPMTIIATQIINAGRALGVRGQTTRSMVRVHHSATRRKFKGRTFLVLKHAQPMATPTVPQVSTVIPLVLVGLAISVIL